MEEERQAFRFELGLMEEGVDHIKNVIAAQQSHARNASLIQPVKLSEVCDMSLTMLGNEPESSQIEIDNSVADDLVVESDRHRILDILVNLLVNAKEAIQENGGGPGLITIAARPLEDGGSVAVTVSDTGAGFAKESQLQLFAHGFTTKRYGHGFGLHSAANQAAALGGSLSLESEGIGRGAVATLTLPRGVPSV